METHLLSYKGDILTAPEQVKDYDKLSEDNKKLFTAFLTNFYKTWEYPEEHQPTKVEFIAKENYLKVIFNKDWLHVLNNTWY